MYGAGMGALNVYADDDTDGRQQIWIKSGPQSKWWAVAGVNVNITGNIKVSGGWLKGGAIYAANYIVDSSGRYTETRFILARTVCVYVCMCVCV